MAKTKAVVVNPRKRRKRRSHARRVGNPRSGGVMGAIKASAPTMGGGLAGGLVTGFLDTKFLSDKPLISVLSKLAIAVVGGAALRRRSPALAAGFAGGVMGGLGYSVGVKLGGGMLAHTKAQALQGLNSMAADDETGKLSDVVESSGLGDVVNEGLGEDGGGIADVVEDNEDDEAYAN